MAWRLNRLAGCMARLERPSRRSPATWRSRKANVVAFFAPSVITLTFSSVNALAAGTSVLPDGRTQTQLSTVGSITDVTTSTVKGSNAFNSFSQFQVGQGDTVNLHVPDSAQRLLNVVHDGPVNVEGIVNGYKDGKIGGDIYFADPYGFVVGKTGSVNVGSLTVRTPTKDAADKLIDANGHIDDSTVSGVIDGTTPVSPDGSVVIRGRISAANGVRLSGQMVSTSAQAADAAAFGASVNTGGLQQGGDIRSSNGDIEITAAGDATIGGVVATNGTASHAAGNVNVTAGGSIALDATASISAKGAGTSSNGGHVKIFADQDLRVASGAKVDVSASNTGDGGTIELSAMGAANFAGATLDAGAAAGQAGSILIDPTNVTIGPATAIDVGGTQASIDTNGGNVTITATDSIVLKAGAFINTRQTGASSILKANDADDKSVGNSGTVNLSARHIDISGTINAAAINTVSTHYMAGNVTLTASDFDSRNEGLSKVDTSIDISGIIKGGAIDIEANSSAASEMSILDQVASDLVSSLFGAGVGYVDAQASAAINVKSGAAIQGTGDVTLNAWTSATASDPALIGPASSIAGTTGFVPSVMVGNVTAKSTAAIATNTTVTSGGTLTVRAHNDDKLEVSQLTITGNVPVDISVAYTTADIESVATVAEGATVAAKNAHITARNDNSFDTSVSVIALGTGAAGIAAAIGDGYTSNATAHFGPSLGAVLDDPTTTTVNEALTLADSLTVEAESMTTKDSVSSSTTVGSSLLVRFFTSPVADALSAVKGKFTDGLSKIFGSISLIKFGASIALTLDEKESAKATIGGDPAHAPIINANQVSVVANTLDQGVRSNADSSTNSPSVSDATPANPTAAFSVSAAVALADRTLTADAEIGSGAQVTAQQVGVYSNVDLPVTITWLEGDDFDSVMSHINGSLGVTNDVLTSYTNATGDAGELGVNGSVNLFNVEANSKAFIGNGAVVNVTGAPAGSWQPTLDSGDNDSHGTSGTYSAVQPFFDQSVAVVAQRDIETINFGGNLSIFLNGAGGTNDEATSVGATYESINYSGDTIAGIGDAANVTSNAGLSVGAKATDKAINVSPTAGNGGGLAISGMVALYSLDTNVHASIAASANVSASSLDLTANQIENIGTVAGALLVGNENSVGGMETTNTIETHVAAYIGDNSADAQLPSASLIPGFLPPVAGVTVTDGTVNLVAAESGIVQSLAVSVEVGDDAGIGAGISVNNINDDVTAAIHGGTVVAKNVYLNAHAADTIHTIAMGASGGGEIAFAGSSAAANLLPSIEAIIDGGAHVTADDNVGLIALNEDVIDTIAGAGAIGIESGGIGLAIVVNQIDGDTTASISNSTVDANALDGTDTFAVNSGTLANAPDVSSISAPSAFAPSLAETQMPVSGLAVVATSHQGIASNAATLGGGGEGGGAIVPATTIISGTTQAFIHGGSVQANLTGDPKSTTFHAPNLAVIAGNHSYAGDFVAAIAASGGTSGAGAAGTAKFNNTTKAYVEGATVGTTDQNFRLLNHVDILANSTQAAATIVLGGAGGMNGGAASLAITLFSANTQAYLTGGALAALSLTVSATSDNAANVLDGAAAVGGIGIGGSIAVTINNDTTLGYVGDMADVEGGNTVNTTALTLDTADISATTNNDLHSLIIAGAGGYSAGIAAMANVTTMSSTTKSGLYGTEVNKQDGVSKAGNITVAAKENDSIDATAGGGAGAGVGVGIAANVVVLHSSVTGTILDSDIASSGAIDVSALSSKDIDALTVTGAVGYFAGVGAAVGVVLIGTDASSDVQGQINAGGSGTLADVDSFAPGNGIGSAVNSGSPDAVTASVAGGTLSAGSLTITSTGKAATSNWAVGVAAGGAAGVGGAVAYTDLGDTVIASLDSASPNAASVSVTAQMLDGSGHAVSTEADAGGAGAVGIGAGVAIGKLSNTVGARLNGSATGNSTGGFSLNASDATSVSSTAAGGAAGGLAVGAMVAIASKNSAISAYTEPSASLTNFTNIDVIATDAGSVDSSATGVSGGQVAAGNAAAATSDDDANVSARLGNNTVIVGASGLVKVSATDTPNMDADAFGVAVAGGAALGVSVALADIDPTVNASVGDNVSITGAGGLTVGATLTPLVGQRAASTSAFAGSGGITIALNGAVALTTNNSDVEASVGDNVTIPDGDIGIFANNTSNQDAYASGIGVGGIAGGASDAESNTDSKTKAKLGANPTGHTHKGALTVQAVGNDTNTSHAVAGTYGLVAGNASIASTSDDADVETTTGSVYLPASNITLTASHQDNYAEFADSTEVSVLGASGAEAHHSANVTVKTAVGDNSGLISKGGIDISAENDFTRIGTDNAANAGGGGVLNGAGATSDTSISGSSSVVIGDFVSLVAGTDLVSNPGHINLLAHSSINASDIVSLSTGGALEGGGVSNDFNATVNNDVSMGADDTFLTFGNFNAGTYTLTGVSVQALASTWGVLGAIADADANLSIVTNQSVELGADSIVEVYGNANLTAGQNPADAQDTELNGSAQAETYVRSLIAIPAAHAGSDLTNNTSLTIAGGSSINAGQNVTIGSYMGQVLPSADGTGHGFELGFIPATNGGQHALAHGTTTADIEGNVTAGAYNDLAITVADCKDHGVYCSQIAITGNLVDASQISPIAAYLSNFSAVKFINGNATGDEASFLANGVSTAPVDAIELNTLFASPGNVTVHADTLTGGGSLTANGGATITVNNASPDYLVLGQIRIPDLPGGHVFFTGKADGSASTLDVAENSPGGATTVTITDTYSHAVGNSILGPAIFIAGSIENLGGLVQVVNANGSLGQFASIVAQDVVLDVPQGSLLIDLAPGLLEPTGASVEADWAPFMVFPGGNPANGAPNADLAIAYAVNAVYNPNYQYQTAQSFTGALSFTSDPGTPITPISRFGDGKGAVGATLLVYGICLPNNSGPTRGCSPGDSAAASPLDGYWDLCNFPGFGCGGRGVALVPVETLTINDYTNVTSANENTQASAINANTISIHATYIDIDSDVTAGPPTNWSVDLGSSAASEIVTDQQAFQNGSVSNPKFSLNGAHVIGAGDSLIDVSYIAGAAPGDGKIVIDNVLAAAQVAASIKIDGGIISTNGLGRVHVNAGLGQVQINNQTGTALTVNNISAGNSDRLGGLTGSIEIIDRLKTTGTDHYWYVYTPGQGTDVYTSTDPNATRDQATLISADGTSNFTYNPLAGMRWQWSQTAFVARNVALNSYMGADPTSTAWFFTDPNGTSLGNNANNPWYYTDTFDPASAVAGSNGSLFLYNGHVLTQDPAHAGSLLMNQSTNLPYMQETISGTVKITKVQAVDAGCIFYGGIHCGTQAQGDFNTFQSKKTFTNFLGLTGVSDFNSYWDFDYISQGTVTMTTSVKADNPIKVDFSGSTRGNVSITSNAPVTLDGQITNPQGDTTIASTGGGIATTTNGSVTSNNLTLNATGAVGAAANLFDTTQTNNGTLSATGNQGIYLAATGALNIAKANAAAGDVVLSAQGDIMAVGSQTLATVGNNITLVAAHEGSIGTAISPIRTIATGALNATADGDIVLEQTQGDLFVGSIRSLGIGGTLGDVEVIVNNGALKDAQNTTSAQALNDAQQQSVWKALKLTAGLGGGINSTSNSPTVVAVKGAINTDYQQYWMLLGHGTAQGGAFTLDPASAVLFQSVAAAAGLSAQDYAASLYAKVIVDFQQYVGTDWQTQAAFQAQVGNFDFVPTQAQLAALTNNGNATWTEGELKSALSLTALQPSSNTTLGTTTPNISGATVILTAANGVGSLADAIHISIADLTLGNLSGEQERAIALARSPGDIIFTGIDAQNQQVRFSGSLVPEGVTISGVDIQQAAPVFVSATNRFDASVQQGGVFAQATSGDLKLGSVSALAGDINLAAPHSIVAATAGTTPVIEGGNISLLAGSGDIGSSATALIYSGASIASASAGQDVYLQAYGTDMIVGRVFAGGDVSLAAPDGSILPSLDGVAIQADNLHLVALGDIGSSAHPFGVSLAGTLIGSAGGAAALIDAGNLDVSSFTAKGDLSVTAFSDINADSLISTNGDLQVAAGNDAALGSANAHDAVTITVVNNLSLGSATSGAAMIVQTGGDIDADGPLSSGGNLRITAGKAAKLANTDAHDAMTVTSVKGLSLTNATSQGAMILQAGGNIDASSLASTGGTLQATSGGNATFANVSAHAALTITSTNDLSLGSATSGSAMIVQAGGDIALAGNATTADSIAIIAGGNFAMAAHALVSTVRQASLTAGGSAVLGQVKSLFDGDHAIDINAASIAANGDGQTNFLATGIDGKVYLTAQSGIGSSSQYIYIDTPWLSPSTISGGIYIHALSSITMPNIHAPGELQIVSDHSLALGDAEAAGPLGLSTGDDLTFGNLITGGNAALGAGNAITGRSLAAAGSAVVTAGLGSFQIASLSAADLTLTSLGNLDIAALTINGPVLISAPNIKANITNAAAGPLQIDVTGPNDGVAHSADLHIVSANGILFDKYVVENGMISTDAAHIRFEHGNVSDSLLLTTPFTNLYLNNLHPTPVRNVTEQFFAPGKTFFLDQDGTATLTDAFLVAFGAGYTVMTLGPDGTVTPALSLVQVGPLPLTAPAWTRIFMQSEDGVGGLILTDPWFGNVPDFGHPDEWISSVDGGVALNISNQ